MWQALPFCLLALAALGWLRRDAAMAITPAILLYDWAICTAYVMISESAYPWMAFAVFDFLAGLAVSMICVSHWQRAIIASYAIELICHAAFGLSEQGAWALYDSYYVLLYAAWLQAILCIGWLVYEHVCSGTDIIRGWYSFKPSSEKAP